MGKQFRPLRRILDPRHPAPKPRRHVRSKIIIGLPVYSPEKSDPSPISVSILSGVTRIMKPRSVSPNAY